VPLFFEYAKIIPRKGWEDNYQKALAGVIERLRAGYIITRIEGRTSPEGPLQQKAGFEGNISLAQGRAAQAQKDVQAALDQAIGKEEVKLRDRDSEALRRLSDARRASYEVTGVAPGGDPASAELFGTAGKAEVRERDMLKHLQETLKAPKEGDKDPLAEAHVIGAGLPPDVRAEVEAEVKVFREGKRDGKALKERALLETIYRPLRRALIVLKPPPPPPVKLDLNLTGKDIERIIGQPIDCLPEHQDLFDNTLQDSWYEGECQPKGGVAGQVK
jgi:hypothetical protein